MSPVNIAIDLLAALQIRALILAGARRLRTGRYTCPECHLTAITADEATLRRIRADHESGKAHPGSGRAQDSVSL